MQNAILQLLENPFISCLFCLQKGVSAHICVGQKGTSSVCFCPCYKSWFQMCEKKTSLYFNSSMLLWCHLRMWGNPLRKWQREEVTRGTLQRHSSDYSMGHPTTAQVSVAAWLRKLELKNTQTQCVLTSPFLPQLTPTHPEVGLTVILCEMLFLHVLCSLSGSYVNLLCLM